MYVVLVFVSRYVNVGGPGLRCSLKRGPTKIKTIAFYEKTKKGTKKQPIKDKNKKKNHLRARARVVSAAGPSDAFR